MGKKLKTSVAPEKKIGTLIAIVLLVALYIFLFLLDNYRINQYVSNNRDTNEARENYGKVKKF